MFVGSSRLRACLYNFYPSNKIFGIAHMQIDSRFPYVALVELGQKEKCYVQFYFT